MPYDWNTVKSSPSGCLITLGCHRTGEQYKQEIFIPLRQIHSAIQTFENITTHQETDDLTWYPTTNNEIHSPIPLTRKNVWNIMSKLTFYLYELLGKATIALLESAQSDTENDNYILVQKYEYKSVQEIVFLMTQSEYGVCDV